MALFVICYKELWIRCIRSRISHRNNASTIVLQFLNQFILQLIFTINTFSPFSCASGIASLDNEILNISMKDCFVVVSTSAESEEVFRSLRNKFAVDFEFYIAEGGVQCNWHFDGEIIFFFIFLLYSIIFKEVLKWFKN